MIRQLNRLTTDNIRAGQRHSDPALTARIMHMANSAYYGLSGRVQSSAFAITIAATPPGRR
mgnify:CR=1 FL=1